MAHLVTGYAGKEHIKSADQGSFNASFFGMGEFVMNTGSKFNASIIDNNTVRVEDGDLLMHGRHIRIEPNTTEDMTISTGTAGKKRIDLIVMTYEKDATDATEIAYLEVLEGDETEGEPSAPTIESGNILEGATKNQMPLYEVRVEGVVLSSIRPLFSISGNFKMLADEALAEFRSTTTAYEEEYKNVVDNYGDNVYKIAYRDGAIKNIIPFPYVDGTTKTESGITFTMNDDGGVDVRGKASSLSTYTLAIIRDLKQGERYILMGGGNGVNLECLCGGWRYTNSGNTTEFTALSNEAGVFISVTTGDNIETLVLPQLILASDVDDLEYKPYALSNRTLSRKLEEAYAEIEALKNKKQFTRYGNTNSGNSSVYTVKFDSSYPIGMYEVRCCAFIAGETREVIYPQFLYWDGSAFHVNQSNVSSYTSINGDTVSLYTGGWYAYPMYRRKLLD